MARISYISPGDAAPEVARLFQAHAELGGRVTNFHRLLGHIPWFYKWYIPLQNSVKGDFGRLPKRIVQLIHIRASVVNACAYCTSHTSALGQTLGMSNDELDALRADPVPSPAFTEEEAAVLRWTQAVADNSARRDQAAFAELQRWFDEGQIVEITVIAAVRTMVNRIQEALWTDLEEPGEVEPAKRGTDSTSLESYAREVLGGSQSST
ncbi:MAG: hypothetical protein GEU93_06500 [Propionibacteriales bacterium]|nr:hypothetical protein [Propionibacteriales bacterium]